jgi:hypothetical protein
VTKRKRPPRPRSLRRALERDQDKLAAARRRLIALEAGGTPGRPIEVASAAVIEARAASVPCPDCAGELRAEGHDAFEHEDALLREVRLICRRCGGTLAQYFRIVPSRPN